MVYRLLSAFLTFFLRGVSHFKGRHIRQILANIMKIYSYLGGRLIRTDMQSLNCEATTRVQRSPVFSSAQVNHRENIILLEVFDMNRIVRSLFCCFMFKCIICLGRSIPSWASGCIIAAFPSLICRHISLKL